MSDNNVHLLSSRFRQKIVVNGVVASDSISQITNAMGILSGLALKELISNC